MRRLKHLGITLFLALALLVVCVVVFAVQGNATVVQAEEDAFTEAVPVGGFAADGDTVNAAGSPGASPALVVNAMGDVWTALRQADQIVVAKLDSATDAWVQQGDTLSTGAGSNPTLALDDANGSVEGNTLWAAWTETTNNSKQVMTAHFDGSTWQSTGVLDQDGDQPTLATGATATDATPLPWIAWAASGGIAVKRVFTDTNGQEGVRWESVGVTLTLVSAASAADPDLVFAGAGNHTPWLAWREADSGGNSFVFAARAITDSGGLQWAPVGRVATCTQENCNLTGDSSKPTQDVHLAAGALLGETTPNPWVVFATETGAGHGEIRVLRLDDGDTPADLSDDRFIPVGNAVNTQCLGNDSVATTNGSQPDIFFVGAAPHVAWIETKDGVGQLFVCHLADARPGQERWDLDTIFGINRSAFTTASAPALSGNGNTPYVAWQEGNSQGNVFVAHRYPDGPAWGSNRPPFIRTISWSRNLVGRVGPEAEIARTLAALTASTEPLTLTTSCDHVNGWEHISEIQFKVANDKMTAFSGKYVAAEDKVYVEDPDQPGTFLGGVTPGSNVAPIETAIATLYVADMRVRSHGDSSPVLDIDWIISFNEPTMFQDLKQMINIVYDDGQATGFFETGVLSFDYRIYMPTVQR